MGIYNISTMLEQIKIKNMGLKGKIGDKINQPNFVGEGQMWKKDDKIVNPFPEGKKHQYFFYKYGKSFGMKTKRYVEIHENILFYFESEKNSAYLGYLILDNTYMGFFQKNQFYMLYLTNGSSYAEMYFQNTAFIKKCLNQLHKHTIQTNFYDKFDIKQELGDGSFSRVFLVQNKKRKHLRAAKMISKVDKHGEQTKSLVLEEKKIILKVNSPYICQMYELFEQDKDFILLLQYIQGKELYTILKNDQQLSLQDSKKIIKQSLMALSQLHKHNILHRDLKPQNIMINDKGDVKMIDFGLSLLVTPKTKKSEFRRCGTMGYMAPEVINSDPKVFKLYDNKCDIFSMGIIVHMMLMGTNPLKGATFNQTYRKNMECKFKLNEQAIQKQYGFDAVVLLRGMLQIDPDQRFSAQQALYCHFLEQSQKIDNLSILRLLDKDFEQQDNKFSVHLNQRILDESPDKEVGSEQRVDYKTIIQGFQGLKDQKSGFIQDI